MIEVFNGRNRKMGTGQKTDIHVKVYVELRKHLHLFKGSSLSVFLCIALHSDEHGWAFPSLDTISRETGLGHNAIYAAIAHLRVMEIEGKRVLIKYQKTEKGKFSSNHYLIFPSAEEVVKFSTPSPENRATVVPSPQKRATENRVTKENHVKEEPIKRKRRSEEEPSPESSHVSRVGSSRAKIVSDFSIIVQRELPLEEENNLKFLIKNGLDYHDMYLCTTQYIRDGFQVRKYGPPAVRTIFLNADKIKWLKDSAVKDLARTTWNCQKCSNAIHLPMAQCLHCGDYWATSLYEAWINERKERVA